MLLLKYPHLAFPEFSRFLLVVAAIFLSLLVLHSDLFPKLKWDSTLLTRDMKESVGMYCVSGMHCLEFSRPLSYLDEPV